MIRRALEEFRVPAERAIFIGDTAADIEAGAAAGCRTIRVGDGVTFLDAARQAVADVRY
jgi:beta-phosphoglucomutase-like phosphatase (HAD superfamily)